MNKYFPLLKTITLAVIIGGFFWWFWSLKQPKEPFNDDTLTVGTNAEYPPYTFIQDDMIVGFDIDVIKHIAHKLNKKIDLQDMPFDALLPAAQLGTIEVIAAGISPTPERAKKLLFTEPYLTGDPLLIISKKNNPLTSLESLTDKNVVVNEGFHADHYISDLKGPIITRLATVTEAFMALTSDRSDAFVSAKSAVEPYFKQQGSQQFEITELDNVSDAYALAISPKNKNLLPKIQEILITMKEDGTLKHLKEKWNIT